MNDISLELKNLEAIFRAHEKSLIPPEWAGRPRNPFLPPLPDEEDPYADIRERFRAS